jgi:hypothetical protein
MENTFTNSVTVFNSLYYIKKNYYKGININFSPAVCCNFNYLMLTSQAWANFQLQWKPLNVITDNVIIRLMLSVFQRPAHFNQTCRKNSVYCNHMPWQIRLMLSVLHQIHQNYLNVIVIPFFFFFFFLLRAGFLMSLFNLIVLFTF